jgi:cytochrome c biogenesis protein CcmG, thiol:disulfide interchange protein DsbE
MNAIHEEFKARGLTVLLVNIREELDTVRRAVRDRHYMAPVVLDPDGRTANIYRVTGTPTVYLLDREQHVIGRAIGRRNWASDDARRLLTDALVPPSGPRP